MDYAYKDFSQVIRSKGLNGYQKQKSVDEIAQEVLKGIWGNGTARKKKLTAAGYDYATVQQRVNELLR